MHSVDGIGREKLTFEAPTPQNGQTHSNNLFTVASKLRECVCPFCGLDA